MTSEATKKQTNQTPDKISLSGVFVVSCKSKDGKLRWEDTFHNMVVTVGKNDLLSKYFSGSSYTAEHYVGLKGVGAITAEDTMSSKAWSEIVSYSNTTRPTFIVSSPSDGSIGNAAAPAAFSISASASIAGCFITTNGSKSGTSGVLFSAVDFASLRSVQTGDTLTVSYTVSC